MIEYGTLHALVGEAMARHGSRIAVEEASGVALTYRDLDALADRVRDRLRHFGVERGDRVGVHVHKSMDAVAAILGILRTGAAYVPVDPEAPAARCASILHDCAVKVVITESTLAERLRPELDALGATPRVLAAAPNGGRFPLVPLLDVLDADDPAPVSATDYPPEDGLAYILYTSGSTGKPKGVMLSHRAGVSYVQWCGRTFSPTEDDVFSSHAPFHFDLSILDIYVPLVCGARIVLIGEALGREPLALAQVIADRRITVWYSVPSILAFLDQYGRLEEHDFRALRFVLFAGEVFPLPQLRAVRARWPHARYFNLFGPTETNVCTFHEVPPHGPPPGFDSLPIGSCCDHLVCRVVDPDGHDVPHGDAGELVVSGAGILDGYWNLPEHTARAFLPGPGESRWYRTGDLVAQHETHGYIFHGRRDRMVKRRGYRIELGEIEAGLARHPLVREVAVVADADPDSGTRIRAVLGLHHGQKLSIIQLRTYSSGALPKYMIPDVFTFVDALPRTSTDKVDYQALR